MKQYITQYSRQGRQVEGSKVPFLQYMHKSDPVGKWEDGGTATHLIKAICSGISCSSTKGGDAGDISDLICMTAWQYHWGHLHPTPFVYMHGCGMPERAVSSPPPIHWPDHPKKEGSRILRVRAPLPPALGSGVRGYPLWGRQQGLGPRRLPLLHWVKDSRVSTASSEICGGVFAIICKCKSKCFI